MLVELSSAAQLQAKQQRLFDSLREMRRVIIAFSGHACQRTRVGSSKCPAVTSLAATRICTVGTGSADCATGRLTSDPRARNAATPAAIAATPRMEIRLIFMRWLPSPLQQHEAL